MVLVRCVLALSCLFQAVSSVYIPPESVESGAWEPVAEYRKRLGITYNYNPKNLHPELCRHLSETECQREDEAALKSLHRRRLGESTGDNITALVLLIQFPDHANRNLSSPEYFADMCNTVMNQYFQQQSYGQYNAQCDVQDWFTTDNSEEFYAAGVSGLRGTEESQLFFQPALNAMDAAALAANDTNFWGKYDSNKDGLIDAVMVFHSGYAAEFGVDCTNNRTRENGIFSQGHVSSYEGWVSDRLTLQYGLSGYSIGAALLGRCGDNPAKMGVPTHEWIHTFGPLGPPDLYDKNVQGSLAGTGGYDIMSSPFGSSGTNGDAPGSLSPWTKKFVGWIDPTNITEDGVYTMKPSTQAPDYFIIRDKYAENEYLLMEYRRPEGFDSDFYGDGGMVIYHIDDDAPLMERRGFPGQEGWPENGNHYQIAVLAADGLYDLENARNLGDEGDLWLPGMSIGPGTGTNFPNTDSYKNGEIVSTGITITVLSMDENELTFQVEGMASAPAGTDEDPAADSSGDDPAAQSSASNAAAARATSLPWIMVGFIAMRLFWGME